MGIQVVPEWMAELEEEDVAFLKNFLLCSGSLKEIAGLYGVTYPHGAAAAGQNHPKGAPGGGIRRRPLCGADKAAGLKREAGLRHGEASHHRVQKAEGRNLR